MMRFKKIKFDLKAMSLVWTTESGSETHEHDLTSGDQPDVAFVDALTALASDVINVCELDTPLEGLRVQSVSLSYSEKSGLRGAVVTALKPVMIANAPVVLNTPHLMEDGEEMKGVMPRSMWRRIETLEREAALYLTGKRAPKDQIDAFAGEPTTEPDEDDDGALAVGATVRVGKDWVEATPENLARASAHIGGH